MIHHESNGFFRAGLLLAVGAAFGVVGLLLSLCGTAAGFAFLRDASPLVAQVLAWGPWMLVALGGALALGSALVLSFGWFERQA